MLRAPPLPFLRQQDEPKCPRGTVLCNAQAENFIGWPTDDKQSGTGKEAPPSLQQDLNMLRTTNALQEHFGSPNRSLGQGESLSGFPSCFANLKHLATSVTHVEINVIQLLKCLACATRGHCSFRKLQNAALAAVVAAAAGAGAAAAARAEAEAGAGAGAGAGAAVAVAVVVRVVVASCCCSNINPYDTICKQEAKASRVCRVDLRTDVL